MPTLLQYLSQPNPEVDRTRLRPGPNTSLAGDYVVEGVRPWVDFTFGTMMKCYGDILQQDFPGDRLEQPAYIRPHERNLTDESSVTNICLKHHHSIVNCALELTHLQLQGRELNLPLFWSWGSLSHIEEDSRLRPDWAGILCSGDPPYQNRVPGDTKQSAKWMSAWENATTEGKQDEFYKPLNQVLRYASKVNSRYGYILTDAEVLCFRRTKSLEPAQPLSVHRARRPPTSHARVTSVASVISGTSMMSIDSSGSPYTDNGNPDINEAPLEIAAISWNGSPMTVNLALWFIHLLAASDCSVQDSYPEIGSWQQVVSGSNEALYRQVGSQKLSKSPPTGKVKAEPGPPGSCDVAAEKRSGKGETSKRQR